MLDTPDHSNIITLIKNTNCPEKLNRFIDNADRRHVLAIRDAALKQLASLSPAYKAGTLEYEFWQTLNAYELVLHENGKSRVRLVKSRQKVAEQGIEQTLTDWTLMNKHEWAFHKLIENNMVDLTGDAVILRHSRKFNKGTVKAARKRLVAAGAS